MDRNGLPVCFRVSGMWGLANQGTAACVPGGSHERTAACVREGNQGATTRIPGGNQEGTAARVSGGCHDMLRGVNAVRTARDANP
ncbi:MAG: hypothetical protein ACRDGS_12540, partial [Chloroflexota bacterium]